MRLFRKNKQVSSLGDKAAGGIANVILRTQKKFASVLDRLTIKWQRKQQWIFLYLICLFFGGLSVVAIIHPFRDEALPKTFVPKSIAVPKIIYPQQKAFVITDEEFRKIEMFKDSNPDLIRSRPALYDSLNIIEQVYHSQKK